MTPSEFSDFLRANQSFVHHFARLRMRASREDFDDALQETRLSLWKACETWQADGGRGSIRSWASFVMKRHAITAWQATTRNVRKGTTVSLDAPRGGDESVTLHDCIGDETAIDVGPEDEIGARAVRRLVESLPPLEREVISRRFFGKEKQAQVAKSWGVKVQWAQQVEAKALGRLKKRFAIDTWMCR